jgi:hypothetical protein
MLNFARHRLILALAGLLLGLVLVSIYFLSWYDPLAALVFKRSEFMPSAVSMLVDGYAPELNESCEKIDQYMQKIGYECTPLHWSWGGYNFSLYDSMITGRAWHDNRQYIKVEGNFNNTDSAGELEFLKKDADNFSKTVKVACLSRPDRAGKAIEGEKWKIYIFDEFVVIGKYFDDVDCVPEDNELDEAILKAVFSECYRAEAGRSCFVEKEKECLRASDDNSCYYEIAAGTYQHNPEKAEEYCDRITDDWKGICITNVAAVYAKNETEKAVQTCKRIGEGPGRDSCLAGIAVLVAGNSTKAVKLCNQSANQIGTDICLNEVGIEVSKYDAGKAGEICGMIVDTDYQIGCFYGSAENIAPYNGSHADELCDRTGELGGICHSNILMEIVKDGTNGIEYCNQVEWVEECLEEFSKLQSRG